MYIIYFIWPMECLINYEIKITLDLLLVSKHSPLFGERERMIVVLFINRCLQFFKPCIEKRGEVEERPNLSLL